MKRELHRLGSEVSASPNSLSLGNTSNHASSFLSVDQELNVFLVTRENLDAVSGVMVVLDSSYDSIHV